VERGAAFSELGLHRLEANIQPENKPSKALVQRVGFRYEGFSPQYLRIGREWKDHERWAILAGERDLPGQVATRGG
jgi:ribosomal-protein-alanine N-acetyltransferase